MDSTTSPIFDVNPDFRDRLRTTYREWETGKISYEEAVNRLEKYRRGLDESNPADAGYAEMQLGVIHGYRGTYNNSLYHLERSRELFEAANNRSRLAQAIINIGEGYRLKGNYARARQYFRAGYEAAVESDNRSIQILARSNESLMLISQGRGDLAEATLLECYRLYQQLIEENNSLNEHRNQLCEVTEALARIYLQTNRPPMAWERAAESYRLAHEVESGLLRGFANRIVAEVLTRMEGAPEGFSHDPDVYFAAALESFREIHAEAEMARTLLAQGKSLGYRNKATTGVRRIQQAVNIFTNLGMMEEAAAAAESQIDLL
jgi:ATP/maltotriose-dependent transcriptional regulator MalT